MTARLISLVLDANDPPVLARFWAEALGWTMEEDPDGGLGLAPTDATAFGILFEPVPERKSSQNNIHLDLTTTSIEDQNDIVARLLDVGGRHVDIGQDPNDDHVVLADPEGNELCIIGPGNNFLAGCERLGAINCDGTRQTGYFWSEVLGWPLVWDQDEETAIRAPDGTGPLITWSGPPLMPKNGKNRLHLDIAPPPGGTQRAEVQRLVSLGATPIDVGQGEVDWVVMADPDGNELCVLSAR
jgi:catechol 2,3-dioxygenase-like lactoylglutathione lyase family enzyme/predicted enzyme related to lactoylglutathione lyase